MKPITYLLIFTGLLNAHAAQSKFQPTDWPAWRGLRGDGHAKTVPGLPVKWSATENVVWKSPLPGRGHSTPTIVGNRIFLATADA